MNDIIAGRAETPDARPSVEGTSPMSSPSSTLRRKLKDRAKGGLRALFEVGQRFGLDILPRHFYSEVPDIRALRRDGAWKLPRTMINVPGAEVGPQFDFLEKCCPPPMVERLRTGNVHGEACAANGEAGFGPIDADFLYAFVTEMRPQRIVQVGCGVSTAIILRAADDAGDYRPEVVCVEPYPTRMLVEAAGRGSIRLVKERAQSVSLETLTDLGERGLLFVDSTHTVQPGSEVNRLLFEVLPRLRPGSWVHFHDIYFPYDYQRGLLEDELFFCNESALVHAFLINNGQYEIASSMSMLHYSDPGRLKRSLPNYRPAANDHGLRTSPGDFPASLYLKVVGR